MPRHLPDLIDPLVCADRGGHYQGELPLGSLPRLQGMIINPEDQVAVDLSFARNGRLAIITGQVEAGLEMVCQRCLEPLRIEVCCPVNLGVVASIDEGDLLPEPYEPLLMEEARIRLGEIVEDELILAIPPIPRHPRCKPADPGGSGARWEYPGWPNPFAELADLKTDDR